MAPCGECRASEEIMKFPGRYQDGRAEAAQVLFHHQITACYQLPRMSYSEHTLTSFCGHILYPFFWLSNWLLFGKCPVSRLATYGLSLLVLAMVILPASAASHTTETMHMSHTPHGSCHRHFGHRIQSCVRPFLTRLNMLGVRDDQPKDSLMVKTICLQYQLTLFCLHSALTECPTRDNLKHVQSTLDSHWVIRVNHLCFLPVETSTTPPSVSNIEEQTDSVHTENPPTDPYQLLGHIKQTVQTANVTKDNVRNNLSPNIKVSHSASLPERTILISPPERVETGHTERPENGGSHDLQLSMYNYVNNYQHDKSRAQQDQDRHRPSFMQVMLQTSSTCSARANLIMLTTLCLCLILAAH